MLHVPEEHEALSNASRFFLIQCSLFWQVLGGLKTKHG